MTECCPVCSAQVDSQCRCHRHDAICINGHEWHTCSFHKLTVLGPSDHTVAYGKCTCLPPTAMTARDKVGNVLNPGDLIVYGHSLGRSNTLRIGKVLSVNYKDNGTFTLTVRGVNDDHVEYEWYYKGSPELLTKASTLQYPHRTLKLSPENISQEILSLLDQISV